MEHRRPDAYFGLMFLYAIAIFLGAFLLFQVQPLLGKFILPWFGGGPGIWTACLLFFQTLLLGGYAYAHVTSTRLRPRQQAILHGVLLALSLVFIPIIPDPSWRPQGGENPTTRILLLLTATIGLPYLVLSATGPLLQHWFAQSHPGRSPYRLYALSNAGSLLALLSYPLLFERVLTRQLQAAWWSAGLVVFVGVCAACAWPRLRRPSEETAEPANPLPPLAESDPAVEVAPSWLSRLLWVTLPAIASVLLLATTNQMSHDVAVVPFLWVLPLALYLVSFILAFDHPRWYRPGVFSALLVVSGAVLLHLLFAEATADLPLQIAGYAGALFVACMVCHGELYRLRPSPRYLTAFYLHIAAGGALGGMLVALLAPRVFNQYAELQFGFWLLSYVVGALCLRNRSRDVALGALVGCVVTFFFVPALETTFTAGWRIAWEDYSTHFGEFAQKYWKELSLGAGVIVLTFGDRRTLWQRGWTPRMGGFVMVLSLVIGVLFLSQLIGFTRSALSASRNFYGTLRVTEDYTDQPHGHHFKLIHGVITHGLQFTHPRQTKWPTTYYGETSGVGRAIKALRTPAGSRRFGLVGLGTGTLATYGQAGDNLRIYEINPDVETVARERFTYLSETAATVEVVLGDARLSMERELERNEPQQFDLLVLDAFSSDAIPVHLLTREALELYLKHLKPGGIIAIHISNRFLDLQPVVDNLGRHFQLDTVSLLDDNPEFWWIYRTKWMLLAKDPEALGSEDIRGVMVAPSWKSERVPLWTDDYSSLLPILR